MIKQLTFSALTGGVLVLAYAAWSKRRAAPAKLQVAAPPRLDETPDAQSEAQDDAQLSGESSIDIALDELWSVDEVAPNANEQLVDFSTELEYDEDEGSVAPEGLGVRWLTRATEAMSPFHHALSLREEAEAALQDDAAERTDEQAPESAQRPAGSPFSVDFPVEKRG